MRKKVIGIILALSMLLTLGLAACEPVEQAAPGAAPAIFGNLKIDNTFITVWDSAQTYIRMTFPNTADTLVGRATTDTLTNKTLTSPSMSSPTITGTSIVSNRASGNITFTTGTTTATITHGMSGTPTRVWLQERIPLGTASSNTTTNSPFIWSLSSTSIRIDTGVATNQTAQVDWFAIVADE